MPPVKVAEGVLSWASVADEQTLAQAARTAGVAAVHGHVALMPDAHLGKGATVGSVIPTYRSILPSAVGVDIGCGVVAGRVADGTAARQLQVQNLPDDLDPLIDEWSRRIPAGLGNWHRAGNPHWQGFVADHGLPSLWHTDRKMADRGPLQLGTLGSGNHFLELCADSEDGVWIMLHSGSRGTGNRLAQHHIDVAKGLMRRHLVDLPDLDLAYLVADTTEFDTYIADLRWAQAYAKANRDRMLHQALDGLQQVAGRRLRFVDDGVIDNHHNYAALEHHHGRDLWITRKGAISARDGELGVVPGSMGTGSYVVRGLGNPASYMSAAHGAGRAMSRRAARKRFSVDDIERAMQGRTWQRRAARSLIDEIPGAYKNLDTVMDDQADLVQVVASLRTIVNYKGTESGRW